MALIAFGSSFLTFFSGFGLGTLLTPAFAIFFPLELSIAMTAVVHLANNLFKTFWVGKFGRQDIVLKFGITAMVFAWVGSIALSSLTHWEPLYQYQWGDRQFVITGLKFCIGILLLVFTLLDLSSRFNSISFSKSWVSFGGALSGFFGGLSGHQGALRSTFLRQLQLPKEVFIGTGVWIALLVDITRLSNYPSMWAGMEKFPVLIAMFGAWLGTWVGQRWIKKVSNQGVQKITAILLICFSVALMGGLI